MSENYDFQLYSFCHSEEILILYDQLFSEKSYSQPLNFPTQFLRSNHTLPLCIPITYSLVQLKRELDEIQPIDDLPRPISIGVPGAVIVDLGEDEKFEQPKQQTSNHKLFLLKSAGMDILRFISQITDMYNDKEFKNKNKSLSALLAQERINMPESDILCEIRHQLTHKQYPSVQILQSAIDYLLNYIKKMFWDPLIEIFNDEGQKQKKKVKKHFKQGNINKQNFILLSREYIYDQLKELERKFDNLQKTQELTQMVSRQINKSQFQYEHVFVYLFSRALHQLGFNELYQVKQNELSPNEIICKRIKRRKKLNVTIIYIKSLFENLIKIEPQQIDYIKDALKVSRNLQFLLKKLQYLSILDSKLIELFEWLKQQDVLQYESKKFNKSQKEVNLNFQLTEAETAQAQQEISDFFKQYQKPTIKTLFGQKFQSTLKKRIIKQQQN